MTSDWKVCKVADLGEVKTGKTPKTSIQENYGGDIPFLTPSDDMSVKYIRNTTKKITELGLSEVKNCLLPADSICVSCIGSDLGKVVITTEPTVTNQQINSIIINNDKYDVDFCYYLMIQLGKLLNYHSKTSTAVPIVNKSSFSNYEVLVPPLETQRKIARVLSAIDDKIELNNAINNNLEQQAQAIFKSWFIDFEPFGGTMPDDWNLGHLSDLAEVKSGKRPNKKSTDKTVEMNIPIVGAASIMGYTNEYLYNEKILVTGRVGTHGIIQKFCTPCWTSDNTLVVLTKYYEFIYQVLKTIDYQNMNRGSTQPLITQTDLKNIEVIIPNKNVLDNYEGKVNSLMKLQNNLLSENSRLTQLRDTLLPKLMNGEIDVDKVEV